MAAQRGRELLAFIQESVDAPMRLISMDMISSFQLAGIFMRQSLITAQYTMQLRVTPQGKYISRLQALQWAMQARGRMLRHPQAQGTTGSALRWHARHPIITCYMQFFREQEMGLAQLKDLMMREAHGLILRIKTFGAMVEQIMAPIFHVGR